jgi:anaerobic dimethyl sulfoxide reductase subunit C
MPAFDWPLTVFTLITQVVLGAFAVLWVTDLLARQHAQRSEQEYLTRIAVWVLGPLMAVGFAASTLHLGQPIHAYRALANVATSWLSREILFLGGFFAMGAVYAALWWRRRDQFVLRAVWGAVTGVVGALGLASMTMLYMVPAMPTWNRLTTPLAFVGTALILGPLLVGAVFLATYRRADAWGRLEPLIGLHLRAMAMTVLVGATLALTAAVAGVTTLPGAGLEGRASLALLTGDHVLLLAGRLALAAVGVGLAGVLLWRLRRVEALPSVRISVWVLLGAFVGAELLGRLLFYAAAVPLRPPGVYPS